MSRVFGVLVLAGVLLIGIALPAHASRILFLGDLDDDGGGDGNVPANRAADLAMIAHLQALGHYVQALDDAVATPANWADKQLVVISATVGSGNAKTALVGAAANFQGVSIPIVNMEPGLGDEMGLNVVTAQGQFNDSQVNVTAAGAAHPLGSGVAAGTQTVFTSSLEQAYWYYLNFSFPGYPLYSGAPGALTVNTDGPAEGQAFGDMNNATTALVEQGGLLGYGQAAPAKRIGLFVGRGSFDDLTPVGLQLFDNAIGYGVPEPATMALMALGAAALIKRRRS
jgi:hypothetical protein